MDFATAAAQLTAFNIAATAARPGISHLVSRETRELAARFLEGRPRLRFWLGMSKRPGFHRWFDRYQALKVPGLALHQTLRNLSLEEAALHGLEAGMEQVLFLGGGFDTMAARLARLYPSARFLELDHPILQAAKRRVLEQTGLLPPNLALAPMDPERPDLKNGPALPGFRPGQPTLVLCEGLLMRLSRKAAERVFADLAALPCPVLRFVFTFMEPDSRGHLAYRGGSRLTGAWLRRRGWSFTWGLPAHEMGGFLARHGFILEEIADAEVFRARFLSGLPGAVLAEGEKVAIASRWAR
ncbi:MAG TPA: class I SAM-dependent methyltransferase [Fibrobacteria bacterium]|nr:class I SAM-dependent methyltransferase [Fibrobacteria bacterium]